MARRGRFEGGGWGLQSSARSPHYLEVDVIGLQEQDQLRVGRITSSSLRSPRPRTSCAHCSFSQGHPSPSVTRAARATCVSLDRGWSTHFPHKWPLHGARPGCEDYLWAARSGSLSCI